MEEEGGRSVGGGPLGVLICCSRSFLSYDEYGKHKREGRCGPPILKSSPPAPPPLPPRPHPPTEPLPNRLLLDSFNLNLSETSSSEPPSPDVQGAEQGQERREEEEDMDASFQTPLISHVTSLQPNQVEEHSIDIVEEGPRPVSGYDDDGSSITTTVRDPGPPWRTTTPSSGVLGGGTRGIRLRDYSNPPYPPKKPPGQRDQSQDSSSSWQSVGEEEGEDPLATSTPLPFQRPGPASTKGQGSVKLFCDIPSCIYNTFSEKLLRYHKQNAHDPHGLHRCSHAPCPCNYRVKSDLDRHLRITHHVTTKGENAAPEIIRVIVKGRALLKCSACGYRNHSHTTLEAHVKAVHNPLNPYKCQYCVCRYSKVTHLTQHLNLKHANQLKNARLVAVGGPSTASPVVAGGGPAAGSVVKPNPPPKLPYTFSEKRLLPGLEGYEQNVQVKIGPLDTVSFTKLVKNNVVGFHCKLCSYQNAYPDAVFIHSKGAHVPDGKYGCPHCVCRYAFKAQFDTHLERAHPDLSTKKGVGGAVGVVRPRPSATSAASGSVSTVSIPAPFKAPATSAPPAQIPAPVQLATNTAHQPQGLRFEPSVVVPSPNTMYRLVIKNGNSTFKCEICQFSAKHLQTCMEHIKKRHGDDAKYCCSWCTCRFSEHPALAVHIARLHPERVLMGNKNHSAHIELLFSEGFKIYKCKACPYVNAYEKRTQDHIENSHDPLSAYECSLCPCRFATSGQLASHKSLLHANYVEPPFTMPNAAAATTPASNPEAIAHQIAAAVKALASPKTQEPPTIAKKKQVLQAKSQKMFHKYAWFTESRTAGGDGQTTFICDACNQKFAKRHNVKVHCEICHNPANAYKCPHCSCAYAKKGQQTKHVRAVHPDKPHSDNPSSSSSSSPSSVKEGEEEEGVELKCPIPGCSFHTKPQFESLLKEHLENAHSPTAKFKCNECPCRFNLQSDLAAHATLTHKAKSTKVTASTSKSQVQREEESSEGNDNNDDSEGFEDVTEEDGEGEENEDDDDDESDESGGENGGAGETFVCKFCDFRSSHKQAFVTHLNASHSKKNKFQCSMCVCRFATGGGLSSHEYRVHKGRRKGKGSKGKGGPSLPTNPPFNPKFDKMSQGLKNSKTAVADTPTPPYEKKSYVCDVCSKDLKNHSSYTHHVMRAHGKGKEFECEICQYGYDTEFGLSLHMSKTHKLMVGSRGRPTPQPPEPPGVTVSEEVDPAVEAALQIAIQKSNNRAARKYAEVEGPSDLSTGTETDDPEEEEDLFEEVKKPQEKRSKGAPAEKCSKCLFEGASLVVQDHEKRCHVENGFPCTLCPCSFGTSKAQKIHMSSLAHSKGGFAYKYRLSLDKDHSGPPKPNPKERNEMKSPSPPLLEPIGLSAAGGETVASTSVRDVVKSPTKDTPTTANKCELCGYLTMQTNNLDTHRRTNHVDGGAQCEFCACSFKTKRGLIRHRSHAHKQQLMDKKGEGQEGDESGAGKDAPPAPVVSGEEEEAPKKRGPGRPTKNKGPNATAAVESIPPPSPSKEMFQCPKCSFSTKIKINLTSHIKSHRGFRCIKCNRVERTAALLNTHMNIFHRHPAPGSTSPTSATETTPTDHKDQEGEVSTGSSEEQLALTCPHCPFTTFLRIKMKRHQRTHTEYEGNGTPAVEGDKNDLNMQKKRKAVNDSEGDAEAPPSKLRRLDSAAPATEKGVSSPAPCSDFFSRTVRKSAQNAMKLIEQVVRMGTTGSEEEDGERPPSRPRHQELHEEDENSNQRERGEIADNDVEIEEVVEMASSSANGEGQGQRAQMIGAQQRLRSVDRARRVLTTRTSQSQEMLPHSSGIKRSQALKEFNRFTCSRCATIFETISQLMAHFDTCDQSIKEFPCKICPLLFKDLLKLKEHIWKSHMGESDREKSLVKPGEKVGKTVETAPFSCSMCKLGLKDRKSFILHLSAPHLFRCKLCSFVSGTKTGMSAHKREVHTKVVAPAPPPARNEPPSTNHEEPEDEILILFDGVATKASPPAPVSKGDKGVAAMVPNDGATTTASSGPYTTPTTPLAKSNREGKTKAEVFNEICVDASSSHRSGKEHRHHSKKKRRRLVIPEPEPELYDSLMCDGCGLFSATVEESRAHNEAIANVASLICYVCANMSSTSCEAVLHEKSHMEEEQGDVPQVEVVTESGEEDVNTNGEGSGDVNGDGSAGQENDDEMTTPSFAIEVEVHDQETMEQNNEMVTLNPMDLPVIVDDQIPTLLFNLSDVPFSPYQP